MINKAGEALTKGFESLRLKAYQDSAGIWTIGWGHTSDKNFTVSPDSIINLLQAENLIVIDLGEAEDVLKKQLPNWQELNENQYAACVDFVFNRGSLKWHSGAETRIHQLLVAKQYDQVGNEFLSFTKDVKGNILNGLLKRRMAEKALYETQPAEDTETIIATIQGLATIEPADLELLPTKHIEGEQFTMESLT